MEVAFKKNSKRRLSNPSMIGGLILASLIVSLIFLGEWMSPHHPYDINMENRLEPSSDEHWFGTDQLGRDVFSRIAAGAKITIGLGVTAILLSLVIGVPIGLISGYVGGRIDAIFMRMVDGILAFPDFILAIAIAGILGPSLTNIIIAIVLVRWIMYARVVRGLLLSEKEKEYIYVSKLSNSSSFKTIRMHLLPQVLPEIIAMAAIDVGKVILLISALSYIGLGAQPPIAEWGAMLNDGRGYFQVVPSLMIYPGLAIMVTVLCFYLLGDGIKHKLDIQRGRNEW
ncbi:nickel transporter permease [Alkalihalobacterium bogoriense]|uniref:nickel transporter permease n=1 Tax=Alkalihalobacterium bogoriense TaxID=246272 RepID=UPI00047EF3FA|nr:nickel transporter permease [Alkalihalobacterium bogoriense]